MRNTRSARGKTAWVGLAWSSSAERSADVPPGESPAQHLDAVHQDDRDPVPVPGGEPGLVDVEDHELVATPGRPPLDDRECLGADAADAAGEEADLAHGSGIVARPMRPFTVLTVVLLLVAIAVAGVAFVIQLISST